MCLSQNNYPQDLSVCILDDILDTVLHQRRPPEGGGNSVRERARGVDRGAAPRLGLVRCHRAGIL